MAWFFFYVIYNKYIAYINIIGSVTHGLPAHFLGEKQDKDFS